MSFVIVAFTFLVNVALILHVVFAIKLSLTLIKRTELENLYMCLLVTWLVPIFGSIAVTKKEKLSTERELNNIS